MWTQAEVSTLNTQNSLAEKGESSGRKKREAEWEAGGRATSPHAATSSSDPRFLIHTHTPQTSHLGVLSLGSCICQGQRMEYILFSSLLA